MSLVHDRSFITTWCCCLIAVPRDNRFIIPPIIHVIAHTLSVCPDPFFICYREPTLVNVWRVFVTTIIRPRWLAKSKSPKADRESVSSESLESINHRVNWPYPDHHKNQSKEPLLFHQSVDPPSWRSCGTEYNPEDTDRQTDRRRDRSLHAFALQVQWSLCGDRAIRVGGCGRCTCWPVVGSSGGVGLRLPVISVADEPGNVSPMLRRRIWGAESWPARDSAKEKWKMRGNL